MTNSFKIAILVSGSGSNLQAIIDATQSGELPIDIVGVISNKDDAYAITRAKEAGLAVAVLSHTDNGKKMGIKTFETHALHQLNDWQPDLVVLAGFMRVLSGDFINQCPAPMINLHPSLLPKYKGLDTHARALSAGDTTHGCSIHVVTAELDAGQVLTQAVMSVPAGISADELQQSVHRLEHQLLPWTLRLIAQGVLPLNVKDNNVQNTDHSIDAINAAYHEHANPFSFNLSFTQLPALPWRLTF